MSVRAVPYDLVPEDNRPGCPACLFKGRLHPYMFTVPLAGFDGRDWAEGWYARCDNTSCLFTVNLTAHRRQ